MIGGNRMALPADRDNRAFVSRLHVLQDVMALATDAENLALGAEDAAEEAHVAEARPDLIE